MQLSIYLCEPGSADEKESNLMRNMVSAASTPLVANPERRQSFSRGELQVISRTTWPKCEA
jgi:hypothetical protein